LRIFTAANGMKMSDLNVVALDANAKTTALFGGTIDVVSGDSPAFDAYVRATGQEPVDLHLADAGVPLLGFGFAVNNAYLAKNPEVVRKFLAATRRGFIEAARDLKAACELIQAKVHLAGTLERCIDYNQGLLALSTPPGDPGWGHQSTEEWTKLIATLKSAGEMPGEDKPVDSFFTNDYVPK
jgi:NitT/TauT family transport system substrate-binding protein